MRGAQASDEALYDLESDPGEQTPIRGEAAMHQRAGDALAALREAVNHPVAQATATVTAAPDELDTDEVADLERRMRQMGYM